MQTYIALLRGINVSGHKIIKMAELRTHLEELKFDNVRTYIQTGNILFGSKKADNKLLAGKINKLINEKYGFDVPTIVITADELKNIFNSNPLLTDSSRDLSKVYATILDDIPAKNDLAILNKFDFPPEEFICKGKVIFGYSPVGLAEAKLSNSYFEKILKVKATSRNWKTISKLMELSLPQ
jgi:uncharacterized protein (DUF1697 family)